MSVLETLRAWWSARKPKPLADRLLVVCNEDGVTVRVLADMDDSWNQSCRWVEIRRVCFKDEGIYQSDLILLEVENQPRPVIVLTEARGAEGFFRQLGDRGLFPREIRAKAMVETSGATHCWPENENVR